MSDATPPLSDDLLIGAETISEYTGLDVRAVYHAVAKKSPPSLQNWAKDRSSQVRTKSAVLDCRTEAK